jgi:type IV secretory pathway protease TraF
MTKNPFINTLSATIYIMAVASVMYFGTQHSRPGNSLVVPIAVLSLFTLSAAVMGYLFLYQPLLLLIDGHKKSAVNLFLQTVAVFGAVTFFILILIFSGVIK